MNKTITRPERFTKFLSHMFPTERDRLYFECIVYMFGTYLKSESVHSKYIELEMPIHDYILKYRTLVDFWLINDGDTPKEIHEDNIDWDNVIVVNMCNSPKTKKQQLSFMNRLYGSTHKIYRAKKLIELNSNRYVFAVKKSLCKDNSFFKTYTLSEYNDKDYSFTKSDVKEYENYLEDVTKILCDIRKKISNNICQLDDLLDIYFNESSSSKVTN